MSERLTRVSRGKLRRHQTQKRYTVVLSVLIVLLLCHLAVFVFPGPGRMDKPFFAKTKNRPLVIAYQGGEHLAPANTMAAFELARSLHVDVLEFDVHITADDHLVAIHDNTVDRTTNGRGRVDGFSLEELKRLDAGYTFIDLNGEYSFRGRGITVPTVDEIFRTFSDMRFVIEIRDTYPQGMPSQIEMKLWTLIHQYRLEEKVLVVSRHDDIVRRMNELSGGTAAISGGEDETRKFVLLHKFFLNGLYRPKTDAVLLPVKANVFDLTDRRLIKAAHRRNMDVYYWTIDDEQQMRELLKRGADGIITNRPDILMDLIAEYER